MSKSTLPAVKLTSKYLMELLHSSKSLPKHSCGGLVGVVPNTAQNDLLAYHKFNKEKLNVQKKYKVLVD